MKILALGAGDMGRRAVIALLSSPKVTAITVADKNYELAKTFIELIGSDRISALEVDVTDHDQLVEVISNHDLVLNTVGPYLKFGRMILEAVIEAKKNYVDICDDWKPMLEILDDLNEKAKHAGIIAIVGIGASPGITNLLAALACSALDEVEEVVTAWGFGTEKSGKKPPFFVPKKKILKKLGTVPASASAAIIHLLIESVGKIPTFRDGKLIEIDALTEAEPLQFPGGGRGIYACHIGHPEPITLSRTLKAKTISNMMFLPKRITNKLREYVKKINNKQFTMPEAAIAIDKELEKFSINVYIFFWLLARFFKLPPSLCVFATGKKNNEPKKVAIGLKYRPYGEITYGMDGMTSVPMAIAALMIIEGKITKKGVLTPEESIDPVEFFDRYAAFCKENLTGDDVLIKKVVN